MHVASAGGTWMALVQGFAGYRWRGTRFNPMLPTRGRRLRFPLRIRGSVLEVSIEPRRVTYAVLSGPPVSGDHRDVPFTAAQGSPVSFTGVFQTSDGAPTDDGASAPAASAGTTGSSTTSLGATSPGTTKAPGR
ncbi:glycosyl hydrolase family 65 protein [Cellulomonas uda]|nr:glycosyl hydrolase family 65 protein [Cellulomonas uda]NII65728.1 hypothetical protein [Cellulomonas uda]